MHARGRTAGIASTLTAAALLGAAAALAHGVPTLSAKQTTVRAGGTVTLSADGMGENGEMVTVTLKGATYQARLGTARLKDDSFDDVDFHIPATALPGTYVIFAQDGKFSAQTQVEVSAAAAPAVQSAQPGQGAITVPRARSPLEWTVAIGLLVVTGGLAAVLLWHSRPSVF